MTARVRALNCFLGSMNLGVTRGMSRSGEGLFATVTIAIAAGIAFASFLRCAGASGAVVFIRVGPTGSGIDRALRNNLLIAVVVVV